MQHAFRLRFPTLIAVIALSLMSLQSRAQLAYNSVPQPTEAAPDTEPEVKAAMKMVHGVIQNEKGPLPGATVWLHGSRTIVVTNAEGEFELQVPADSPTVKLICGYGGLPEQVLTLAPVQAMGSIYLMRTKVASTVAAAH